MVNGGRQIRFTTRSPGADEPGRKTLSGQMAPLPLPATQSARFREFAPQAAQGRVGTPKAGASRETGAEATRAEDVLTLSARLRFRTRSAAGDAHHAQHGKGGDEKDQRLVLEEACGLVLGRIAHVLISVLLDEWSIGWAVARRRQSRLAPLAPVNRC